MFGSKNEISLNEKFEDTLNSIAVEEFAINTAINLIASCIAKCEFKTFYKNKEIKEDEYYTWNIEPNKNQNSTEFIQELISKLLYNNEALVVDINGEFIIADSFYKKEYAIIEDYFENVTIKDYEFNKRFYMSDVLYFKLNNKDISLLLNKLMDGYNKLLNMAIGKYKRAGGRKGIVNLDAIAKGDEEKKKLIDEMFSKSFKAYFENENAVINLPKGVKYEEKSGENGRKATSEITDIQILVKEAFERSAQAFKIPPALLRGDIADIEKLTDNFLTFCIDPLVDLLSSEINRKRIGKKEYLSGTKIKIDTTCIKHIDIFAIAEKIDKLISTGMYSVDELRKKLKDTILNTDWSEKHWITKNYSDISDIENTKGGEKNE